MEPRGASGEALEAFVREVLASDPRVTTDELLGRWRVRRGAPIEPEEAARVAEILARERRSTPASMGRRLDRPETPGNTFSIGEALSFAWSNLSGNLGFFVVLALISLVAVGLVGVMQNALFSSGGLLLGVLVGVLTICLQAALTINWIRMSLRFVDSSGRPSVGDLFHFDGRVFVNTAGVAILIWIFLLILFIPLAVMSIFLAVLPPIAGFLLLSAAYGFFAVRLSFAWLLVVDQKVGPASALGDSWQITEGHFWHRFRDA